MTRTAPAITSAWLALIALHGCSKTPQTSTVTLALELHAKTNKGTPVPGASFWIDGRPLGTSNAEGRLQLQLREPSADAITLTVICPSGYLGEDGARRVALRGMMPAVAQRREAHDGHALAAIPLQLVASCEPEMQLTPLVVRAHDDGRGLSLPVLVNDAVVGRTDAEGHAHVLVDARLGQTLRVTLDTSGAPALSPSSPVRVLLVEETLPLVVDQLFTATRAPKRQRARPEPERAHRRPYEIR